MTEGGLYSDQKNRRRDIQYCMQRQTQEDQQDSCIEKDWSGKWRRCIINCYQRKITPKGIEASKCHMLGGCPYARKQVIPSIQVSFNELEEIYGLIGTNIRNLTDTQEKLLH